MGKFWDALAAHGRQGAKDLHNAIVPAFPTYAHGVDEPGTAMNPQPQAEPKASFSAAVQQQREAAPMAAQEQGKAMEMGG